MARRITRAGRNRGWKDLTLLAGWVAYHVGFTQPQYCVDEIGWVNLRGLIKNGTTTVLTVIAVLPSGLWPSRTHILMGRGSAALSVVEVRIDATGQIFWGDGGGNATWTCLDGLRFDPRDA